MGAKEAAKFPVVASGMLFGLYVVIKYVGKWVVNWLLLGYFMIGGVESIRELAETYASKDLKAWMKEQSKHKYLKGVKIADTCLEFSNLEIYCFFLSVSVCGLYVWTHHWLTNNIIGILFCIFAIQNLFLGSFKVGVGLLWALFFYDIFWVFGTDVMVTVAKNIDGPIKLLFPKNVVVEGPKDLSLLGLGDIVIPGIFVAMCLRYDFLRYWKTKKPREAEEVDKCFDEAPKPLFHACMVGYLLAILATVIVMIIFEHGQPALLYLVPGCCGSVMLTAFMQRNFLELWGYNETEEMERIEEETKKVLKGD
jgi:minor histocompatibility antigen H13